MSRSLSVYLDTFQPLFEVYFCTLDEMDLSRTVQSCKVAIVGAGMAGLGAAKTLINNGVDGIVILEALDEPGGRIRTIQVGSSVIELGAQWLHNTQDSLYNIAKKNNLLHKETSDEGLGIYLRDDGHVFDELIVKKVNFQVGKILEDCEDFVDEEDYPHSVGDFLEEKFLDYLNKCREDSDEERNQKLELFDWNLLFQVIDNSSLNMKQVSAKEWGHYSCLGKDGQSHINISNGYKTLVDLVLSELPAHVLKLKTEVVNIDYANAKKIVITCQNDLKFLADHVIVTSSIGYLKGNMGRMFSPPLPLELTKSINATGFSGIAKIFLVFREKWWTFEGCQFVWRRQAYVKEEESWTKSITGFDLVLDQPNILLGWVGGEGVKKMEELSEEVVGRHCVHLLRRFLSRNDIPYPADVIRSKWVSCPWIKGGYSHSTPECDRLGVGPSTLCQPVYVDGSPRILLAGEAAHPYYFSTTHGAFESGENQAKVLLKYVK